MAQCGMRHAGGTFVARARCAVVGGRHWSVRLHSEHRDVAETVAWDTTLNFASSICTRNLAMATAVGLTSAGATAVHPPENKKRMFILETMTEIVYLIKELISLP